MKMSYTIDSEASLVRAQWSGSHDPMEIQNYIQKLMADPEIVQGLNYLSDQRQLESRPTSIGVETGMVFLKMLQSKLGNYKYAVLAMQADLYDAEQVNTLMQELPGIQFRVFTDKAEAENWLAAD